MNAPHRDHRVGALAIADWRRAAARAIDAAPIDAAPALEAEVLLGHVLGVDRAWLYAHADDALALAQANDADALLARRLAGVPIAYLLGWKEFRSRRFRVSPDVLIPRDDTETLIDIALQHARTDCAALARPLRIVDAGTGTGIVAITLALELDAASLVIALDRSEAALAVAAGNALSLGAEVRFIASDWSSALRDESVDLLVANPPYVAATDPHLAALRFEPQAALVAGSDGLDDIRQLASDAQRILVRTGVLAVEHGADQANAVRAILHGAGYASVYTVADAAGLDRVSVGSGAAALPRH